MRFKITYFVASQDKYLFFYLCGFQNQVVFNRILTYLLLVVFLGSIVGYYPFLEVNKLIVRRTILSKFSENSKSLEAIRILKPENDPHFQRLGQDEFIYKGKMYDVASESSDGSITTFICFHDKKEEILAKSIKHEAKGRFNSKWWNNQIKIAFPVNISTLNHFQTGTLIYPDFLLKQYSRSTRVNSPPPKGLA